jgi:SpoVK/Ycf46/Vps4 family AAA+-type ATPase
MPVAPYDISLLLSLLLVHATQVKWEDVGGLDHIKQQLKEAVEWPQQHPEALSRLGATAPRGILLYGPPGCSKTLLARAVAASAGLNFLSIKGGELYSKYVGESERAVAALFARARAAAPSVVFFDEIDGLAGSRGGPGGSGGVGDRVLAQLLMELDGIQPRLGVVVLGATNRPDNVDPALLRPGRFDRLLYVSPPDAAGRQEILKVQLRRTPVAPDVDLGILAGDAEGYTGADLAAVVREAGMAALQEDIEAAEVAQRHFVAALQQVPPSVPPGGEQQEQQLVMYRAFQRQAPPLS